MDSLRSTSGIVMTMGKKNRRSTSGIWMTIGKVGGLPVESG